MSSKLYDKYLLSTYSKSNQLDANEYKNSSNEYDTYYSRILPSNKESKILDIGCGTGHFLHYIEKKGYKNFLGIDISPEQIAYSKEKISSKVIQADIMDYLSNSHNLYDVIAAHDFLEHVKNEIVFEFLELVYDSLNINGVFMIKVPNMSNPFSIDSRYRDFTHLSGFTEKSLYQILYSVGFKKIEIFSSKIFISSWKTIIRRFIVRILHKFIKFLFYIQDYSTPQNLGKNLIAISKKN